MDETLISVIVPVYNCENYLTTCIDSIMRQSFHAFEIVLIDDGSVDHSGELCDQYAQRYPHIHVIHQPNRGVAYARHKGVEVSRGEYITFIDSDDSIDEEFLSTLYKTMRESDADMVCCNYVDCGIKDQVNLCIEKYAILSDKNEMLKDYFLGMRFAYVVCGKLYRKDVLKQEKFVNLNCTEDTHMILSLFMRCARVALIPYAGYYYRANPTSVTMTLNTVHRYGDILITAKYVCDLCWNLNEELFELARKQLAMNLYGAIAAYTRFGTKEQKEQFHRSFPQYVSILDKRALGKSIKGCLLLLYHINRHFTSFIIGAYYYFRGVWTSIGTKTQHAG